MARFSLVDLVNIERTPNPSLMELLNSAPTGESPLLDNSSIARARDALRAEGVVGLANNPSKNRITSKDPTLDAILDKQHRLTQIENRILEESNKALSKAQIQAGADLARSRLEGIGFALAFDSNNPQLRTRQKELQKDLDDTNTRATQIHEQLTRVAVEGLLKEKNSLEGEIKQLQTLKEEGQSIEGELITGDNILAELLNTTPTEARIRRLSGAVPNNILALNQALNTGSELSVANPLIYGDEVTRQAFKNRALRMNDRTLSEDIGESFDTAYAFISAERTRLASDPNVKLRIAGGEKVEDIIRGRLLESVTTFSIDRLGKKIIDNPAWLLPADITEQERQIADRIITLFEKESGSDGKQNLVNAVKQFARGVNFTDNSISPKETISQITRVLDKMTTSATRRYNAIHRPAGLDLPPSYLHMAVMPEIMRLITDAHVGQIANSEVFNAASEFVRFITEAANQPSAGRGTVNESSSTRSIPTTSANSVTDLLQLLLQNITTTNSRGTVRE